MAKSHVCAATLNDEFAEEHVLEEQRLDLDLIVIEEFAESFVRRDLAKLLFEFPEIGGERVDADRRKRCRVLCAGEKLDEMLEVGEVIIHRSRREKEYGLSLREGGELPVAGTDFSVVGIGKAAVPEVVRLVDNEDIGLLPHALDFLRVFAATHDVGVGEDFQVAESLEKVWQELSDVPFPYGCLA